MRFYGRWAGNPKGRAENTEQCIAEVAEGGRSMRFFQCLRKRGKGPDGLYCGIHARMIDRGGAPFVPKDE